MAEGEVSIVGHGGGLDGTSAGEGLDAGSLDDVGSTGDGLTGDGGGRGKGVDPGGGSGELISVSGEGTGIGGGRASKGPGGDHA